MSLCAVQPVGGGCFCESGDRGGLGLGEALDLVPMFEANSACKRAAMGLWMHHRMLRSCTIISKEWLERHEGNVNPAALQRKIMMEPLRVLTATNQPV
ncbi:hypothetical protein HaLaN_27724, partial [Haematococcus lacustris]